MEDRQGGNTFENGLRDVPTEQDPEDEAKKPGSKRKKYVLIGFLAVFLVLLASVLFGYYRGVVYYKTHFFPNTNIEGIDCSNMEAASAAALLDGWIVDYTLTVEGRDYSTGDSGAVLGRITSGDIMLEFEDTEEALEACLLHQEELMWIRAYLGDSFSYSLMRSVTFDREKLEGVVRSWDACDKGNMITAKDAYIAGYSRESGLYEIVPETPGTELDVDRAVQLIADAVNRQETDIDLENEGCYKEASVKQEDKSLTDVVGTVNKWLQTCITYDWNGTKVVLDRKQLQDWISIEEGKPVLDEEAAAAFVKEQAKAYDTYGKQKKFVTTLGQELTLLSRNYGWKTDTEGETAELLLLIYRGAVAEREPLYSIEAMQKGIDDLGNSYVEADLTHQHLYLYEEGEIVLETDFVSGTMISTYDCVTPEGIFGLAYKTTNAVLKGATYRTPVNYWMPFYGNYGMHDAKWRGSFGGEIFKTNGSHGCINLPPNMAAQIYQYVSTGFPVVCYYTEGIPYVGPNVTTPETDGEEWFEQPIEQPAEQPAAPPVEVPVEQPALPPVEQPVEQPTAPPAEQPTAPPIEPSVEQPASPPAEQPAEGSAG